MQVGRAAVGPGLVLRRRTVGPLQGLLERWLVVLVVRAAPCCSDDGRSGSRRVRHRQIGRGLCGRNEASVKAMSGGCGCRWRAGDGAVGRSHSRCEVGIGRDGWVTLLEVALLGGGAGPNRCARSRSVQTSP